MSFNQTKRTLMRKNRPCTIEVFDANGPMLLVNCVAGELCNMSDTSQSVTAAIAIGRWLNGLKAIGMTQSQVMESISRMEQITIIINRHEEDSGYSGERLVLIIGAETKRQVINAYRCSVEGGGFKPLDF